MSPAHYKWIGFSEFQDFCENNHFSEARRYENAPTCKKAIRTSRRRWRNASLELLFQTWIRSAKLRGSGKLTVKLLDISPAGDAGRLRTVRWNLLYAFVRQGASEGELGP